MEPWESCLPVLGACFVTVVILDARYGAKFKWPSFPAEIQGREVSPTHAEFLMARGHRKRTIVFVRSELMPLYQAYRKAHKADPKTARSALEPLLPDHVEFDALEFLHEVKTSRPVPWIDEFDDVIDLKRKLQHKLLNELAETFLFRQAHLATVVSRFAEAIGTLPEAEQTRILTGIGITKSLIDEIEGRTKTIQDQQREIDRINGELAAEKAVNAGGLRTTLEEKKTALFRLRQERTNLITTGSLSGIDSLFEPVSSEDFLAPPSGSVLSNVFATSHSPFESFVVSRPPALRGIALTGASASSDWATLGGPRTFGSVAFTGATANAEIKPRPDGADAAPHGVRGVQDAAGGPEVKARSKPSK